MLPWGNISGRLCSRAFNDQLMLIGLTLSPFPFPFYHPLFSLFSSLRIVELGNIWRRFLGSLISPKNSRFLWPSRGITPAHLPSLYYLPPPFATRSPSWGSCYDSPHCDLWLMAKDYANRNDLCPTVAAASVQNCEIMENWQLELDTQWDNRRHLSSLGTLNENMCWP